MDNRRWDLNWVVAHMRRIWRDESGQSLAILTITMVAFIAILGLVIDMGYAYARYRQMQMAADGAALVGARELALGNGQATAISQMEQMLVANGADTTESDYTVTGNHAVVTARARIEPAFTPIFGLHSFTVDAHSEATFGQAAQESDVMPFAVDENLWAIGPEVNIWNGETGPGGNYGWVRWYGQSLSTSVLRANIDDPSNSGELHLGQAIDAKPGVSMNAVRASLEAKIGQSINIFLYDPDSVTGEGANMRYTISGFGKFRITRVRSQGSRSEIRGYFVEDVKLGGNISPGKTTGTMAAGLTN